MPPAWSPKSLNDSVLSRPTTTSSSAPSNSTPSNHFSPTIRLIGSDKKETTFLRHYLAGASTVFSEMLETGAAGGGGEDQPVALPESSVDIAGFVSLLDPFKEVEVIRDAEGFCGALRMLHKYDVAWTPYIRERVIRTVKRVVLTHLDALSLYATVSHFAPNPTSDDDGDPYETLMTLAAFRFYPHHAITLTLAEVPEMSAKAFLRLHMFTQAAYATRPTLFYTQFQRSNSKNPLYSCLELKHGKPACTIQNVLTAYGYHTLPNGYTAWIHPLPQSFIEEKAQMLKYSACILCVHEAARQGNVKWEENIKGLTLFPERKKPSQV